MAQIALIALAGAVGSALRYGLSGLTHTLLGKGFPYGTLLVNVIGALLIGLLYAWMVEREALGSLWRIALMTGLLGGFTTFSAFSLETLILLDSGEQLKAAINVLLSVALCLFACWIGMTAGREL